jgi:hypothetical protein
VNYLAAFSLSNLALLSDWLKENGELYVDMYWPHSGGGGTGYFIKSLDDLKSLVSQQTWQEIVITIFRNLQFPLRGIADDQLLKAALRQIPDNTPYEIVNLRYYPEYCNYCGSGKGHTELTRELREVFGELVGIGQEPDVYSGKLSSNIDEVFEVAVLRKDQFQVMKNQDFYKPYNNDPQRYKWIEDMWQL